MAEKTILLISMDEEFNLNIELQVAMQLASSVQLEIISSPDYLAEYLTHPGKADVIIAEEKMEEQIKRSLFAKHLFWLTKDTTVSDLQHISRYGGAQAIVRSLPAEYLKAERKNRRRTHIIDVCSISGGSGKTAAALCTAYRLAEKDISVLYVNLEPFQNFYHLLEEDKNRMVMSEKLLCAMATDPHKAADLAIEEMIHYQIDILPQISGIAGTYQITFDTMTAFLDEMAERQIYDYIIAEYPFGLDLSMQKRLLSSECFILTTLQGSDHAARVQAFRRAMQNFSGYGVIICRRSDSQEKNVIDDDGQQLSDPVCEYIPQLSDYRIKSILAQEFYKKTAETIQK